MFKNKILEYPYLRKLLTALSIIFGLLSLGGAIMCIGGGSVLNDLYGALEEIQDLEKKNLLNNPPKSISEIAKREIRLSHNSKGLKEYIKGTHESLSRMEFNLVIFLTLFFLSLFSRIFIGFRLKKQGQFRKFQKRRREGYERL